MLLRREVVFVCDVGRASAAVSGLVWGSCGTVDTRQDGRPVEAHVHVHVQRPRAAGKRQTEPWHGIMSHARVCAAVWFEAVMLGW